MRDLRGATHVQQAAGFQIDGDSLTRVSMWRGWLINQLARLLSPLFQGLRTRFLLHLHIPIRPAASWSQ